MKVIQIPSPKFNQYEKVILFWQGSSFSTKILERNYSLDKGVWIYKLQNFQGWYSGDVISVESENE